MSRSKIIYFLILSLAFGCAKGDKKLSDPSSHSSKNSKNKSDKQAQDKKQDQDQSKDATLSKARQTFTYSASNNSLTSHTIKKDVASEYSGSLKKDSQDAKQSDLDEIEGALTAMTLADDKFANVLSQAKRLVITQMKYDVNADVPELALLQIAISSFQNRQYTMTQFMITELENTKNKKVKSAVLNIEGLMAFKEDRLPEAAALWKQAIQTSGGYKPAQLNLGFMALKFGDFPNALKYLRPMQNDWFALYGLSVAERLSGNHAKAAELCTRVLSQEDDYKPALLTCGLNSYQGKGDASGGKDMLNKIFKSKNGPKSIDEIAYKVIDRIEKETKQQKSNTLPAPKSNLVKSKNEQPKK